MRRASYSAGVRWIADNDETAETDVEEMVDLISVCLLADLFAIEPRKVAEDVIKLRNRQLRSN